jgi:ubiquinone/menaquinone biosynthesis C-methylase UbiE
VNYPLWAITGIAREKTRRREMFLNESKPGKLLDVGCGDGTFLNLMRVRGWDVDGIDFDAAAIQTAKKKHNLTLRHGDLRAAKLSEATFDAVTMSHVVEHLTDPIGLLREIHRLLKPGGQLVMTTPNTSGVGHQKFGASWFGVDAPRHLHLFNKSNLSEVARRAGFQIAWAGSTSANADVFIGASYTIRENNRHRMGHQPTPSVLRTLKAAYWHQREHAMLGKQLDCGDELVLICKKI